MKKLELNQMESLFGGAEKLKNVDDGRGGGSSLDCVVAGGALIIGALAIGATTGGIGLAIWGIGMGANVFGMMRSC